MINLDIDKSAMELNRRRIFLAKSMGEADFSFIGNFEHIIQAIIWGMFSKGLVLSEFSSTTGKFRKVKFSNLLQLLNNHYVMEQLDEHQKNMLSDILKYQ